MWMLTGTLMNDGGIQWTVVDASKWKAEEGLRIAFLQVSHDHHLSAYEIRKTVAAFLPKAKATWITADSSSWSIDLDELRHTFPGLPDFPWLRGRVRRVPEVETSALGVPGSSSSPRGLGGLGGMIELPPIFNHSLVCYVLPGEQQLELDTMPTTIPDGIRDSLAKFRADYPQQDKVALIMMQFGETKAHDRILATIRGALAVHGISGLRSDDKQYHEDLFPNVQTYMHGCAFGVAVFERIEAEEFNPNVALEVGYMIAMRKPVCLLKDRTLPQLHADLIGKLYRPFDPQDPEARVPLEMQAWLRDHGFPKKG